MKKLQFALLVGAALLLTPMVARAQFRGDVFFANPSVAVPQGSIAIFEVQLFSGADVVGATHVDVVFDPTRAEVVAVEAGTTPELANGLASSTSGGRAAFVDLNGSSLQQPFGTVSLARVHLRPLVAAGTRVPVSIQVRSLLRQDTTPFPNARGFSGEIVVVSASSGQTPAVAGVSSDQRPDEDTAERALAFRRPGLTVDLLDFETRGGNISAVMHQVVVPDPAAPSETPIP